MYPQLTVSRLKNPNRLWAIPLLGGLGKAIYLIPVFIELILLEAVVVFIVLVNSFTVLFNGQYWDLAYRLVLGTMRLSVKLKLFYWGLTDQYPGFKLAISDPLISLDIKKPAKPGRFWAVPLLGGLGRAVLLIPYFLYAGIIDYAAQIGAMASSLPVLLFGKYPESTYEFVRDSTRVSLAQWAYLTGLSDSYPSFRISMNHKVIKIILIVISAVLTLWDYIDRLLGLISSIPSSFGR